MHEGPVAQPGALGGSLRVYGRILRAPGIGRLAAAVVIGGLGLGYAPLGVLLFVHAENGSYGTAGAVLAAYAVGRAVATPPQGRLLDRFGPTPVLVPCGVVHAAAVAGLIATALAGAAPSILIACGAAAGGAYPALPAVLRALWPQLATRGGFPIRSAYALDAMLGEALFVAGIVLGGVVAALASPAAALALLAAAAVAGTLLFVSARDARGCGRRAPTEHRGALLGPLASAPVRVLVLCSLPLGLAFGVFEVIVVAFDGSRESTVPTLLFVAIAAGSIAGGAWYGRSTISSQWMLLGSLAALVPILALAAVASSVVALAAVAILIGVPYALVAAASSQLLIDRAVTGTETEAFTWVTTMLFVGGAAGNALSGGVIDAAGSDAAALIGAAATLIVVASLVLPLVRLPVAGGSGSRADAQEAGSAS